MINVDYILNDLDAILGSNMFLKDADKAESLKGSVSCAFATIDAELSTLNTNLNTTINQTFGNAEDINNIRSALIQYLQENIEISRRFLGNLGEWY